MSPPDSHSDQDQSSLRAAHRARHAAASPEPSCDDWAPEIRAPEIRNGGYGEREYGGRSRSRRHRWDDEEPPVQISTDATVEQPRVPGDAVARRPWRADQMPVDTRQKDRPPGDHPLGSHVPGGHVSGDAPAGDERWEDPEVVASGFAGGPAERAGNGTAPTEAERPERPARSKGRAGRNLPAAIGVAVVLGGGVVASLLLWKPAFYAVIIAAVAIGTLEMTRAVRASGEVNPPLLPLLLGGAAMVGLTWYGGTEALPYGVLGTVVAILVWRLGDGPSGYQRDVVPGVLIAVYVPFLACFAALLFAPDDGAMRVLAMLAGVVLSDTAGYAAGVFLGRHPMSPTVSPKKSWEGFAGSLLATAVGGVFLLVFLLDGEWWHGVVFGLAVAVAGVLGDLAESLLKRDLGIKDMSTLLPGHGGLMDRLDSILFAAPTAYAVLTLLVPPA